ncbi:hypothetical protein Tco_0248314 [Tanacetum coccineum]
MKQESNKKDQVAIKEVFKMQDCIFMESHIKAKFGGNESIKEDAKESVENNIETIYYWIREELDSAYEGYTQAFSSKGPTAPNVFLTQMKSCSFYCNISIYATTHDDEDLLQSVEEALGKNELTFRWHVDM